MRAHGAASRTIRDPRADRKFINHTYNVILRTTQAKLVLLKALEERADDAEAEVHFLPPSQAGEGKDG